LNDKVVPVAQQSLILARQMRYLHAPMRLETTNGGHVLAGYGREGFGVVLRLLGDCALGAPRSICAGAS